MISDEIKSQVKETRENHRVGGTPKTSVNENNNGPTPIEDKKDNKKEDKENKTFTANSNDTFNANQQEKDFKANEEEQIPEEDAWLHLQDPTKVKPKKKDRSKDGKLDGNFDDDLGEADTDPLKIQEGDIIDYMMKEIILASANWAGGKIAGWTGYIAYRIGSKTYHGIADKTAEGWNYLKQDFAKIKQDMENTLNNSREVGGKPEDFDIKDGDDKTTVVSKLSLRYRYQNTHADTSLNEETIANLTKYALEGKLSQVNPDEIKKIPSNIWERFKELEAQEKKNPQGYSTLSDDKKKESLDQAVIATTATINTAKMMEQFVSDYAAAMVINEQQKDQKHSSRSPEELKAIFDHYRDEARKIAYIEMKKINHGEKGKTMDSLVELSTDVLKEQQHNLEKGLYKEKGQEPKTSAFSKLEKLRDGKDLENQNLQQLMTEAFKPQTLGGDGSDMKTKLKNTETIIQSEEDQQRINDEKRKKIEKHKQEILNKGKNNDQKKTAYQGPIIMQNKDKGRS